MDNILKAQSKNCQPALYTVILCFKSKERSKTFSYIQKLGEFILTGFFLQEILKEILQGEGKEY